MEIAKLVRRKLRILGSFGAPASTTMPEVIRRAAEGAIDLERLITDRFAFEETAEAYRKLNEREIRGREVVMVEPELG
ncbi:hypothetical protein Bra3105_13445 [Brachybacterium halotolerans subsp. kimchii]|uniref:hypothetical protein n=1 Tax=Brachybacterium halotolerans TaxID=2795215 RepID=UPI001E63C9EE|nr:hypothetical protein [Brachybacterium halotolerans]UEJ81843.1 hypothetical protein Bra3105_13445 [Brachybacterium halotolerans subsp. kimchii]